MKKFDLNTGEKFLNDLQRHQIALNQTRIQRMVQTIVQTAMEIEVTTKVAASRYERQSSRRVYRNGYRDSVLQLGADKIHLRIPRVRRGTYHPTFLNSSKRWHDILIFARLTFLQGTTTAQCEHLLERLGISSQFSEPIEAMHDALVQEYDHQQRASFSERWQKILLDIWLVPSEHGQRQQVMITAVGEDAVGKKELLTQTLVEENHQEAFAAFIWQLEQRNIARIPYEVIPPHRILREVVRRNVRPLQMQHPPTILSLLRAA